MAEYEGKKVKLNDPFRLPSGSKKKFGVYVKNPKTGNVIKVEFGDPNMSIKRDDPERLKNFRARHNCDQKTDKTTPGYWSCKFWEKDKPVSKLLKKGKVESVGEGCGCDECMSEDKHDKKGKDMDPRKHVALSKKNPGMYCVFDAKGREVKLFKKKSDAEAYAIKNHDELMKENVNESRKKKITYVINRRTGEVVYGPTDVADAKQFLKKQPQPRKFVIRDIRESVQLDEQGSIVKTFGNTRDYMPLIKKFGMEKQFRSMMRDLKKFGESGDGLIMIYSDKMLEFIIEPLEDSHYVTKAAQRGGPMTGKNLVKKDVRARGAKGVDARVIAFKESEYNPLDEQSYVPGQAKAAHGGASRRGGSRGPRMSRQRKNRAEVLDQLALNGIQVLNQPQVVTGKGGSDTFVVAKKDVKKAKKVLDDYFEKPYVKIHMGKKGLRRDNYTIVAESVNEVYKDSGLGDWFGKGGGGGKEEGGWDRYNTAGERIGKCGDAKKGAAYSACLSAEKAKQLRKEKIAEFVKRKRDAQKKAGDKAKGGESKKGQKPVMVKTGAKGLDKKNESYMSFKSFISEENVPNNPALWKKAIAKAKEKFDVYPSAYANAWASKWYKSKGGTWSKK